MKAKIIRWTPEMIQNLIKCLYSYKTRILYNGVDFDADSPLQYRGARKCGKIVRGRSGLIWPSLDFSSEVPLQELSKEEEEEFKKQR